MDSKLFLSTFILIFIAELPDKTAFASLLLATKHKPLAVFLGAAAAFVIQSIVAVLFGSAVGYLPANLVHRGAGILFLVFAITMALRKMDVDKNEKDDGGEIKFWTDAGIAFMTIFVAEWGDLTQLATATLVAKYRSPGTVFVAATLALWAVSGLGVFIGYHSRKAFNPIVLKWVATVAFTMVGIWLLVR